MDQPNPPQTPSLQRPNQELPHLIVEEPKRGVFGTLGVVVLSIALLGIPLGIFLVSQRTQLAPQAAVIEQVPEAVSGIFLESKLSSGRGEIPVDIYVKSPVDQINLVNTQIKFDPDLVSVDKIATNAAELNQPALFSKWIEVSFDNNVGVAAVIAGLPTPGLKTGSPNDEKVYLATLYLKPKTAGATTLQVMSDSQILRNQDSANIFKTGNDLVLNLSAGVEASPLASPPKSDSEEKPLIVITSPAAATNYSYFKSLEIAWSSFNAERISQIDLYVNRELLGSIAQNLEAKEGRFEWVPKDTLALHYIQLTNTYEIEITGVSKDGLVTKTVSAPFGILGTEEIIGEPPNPESFGQNQLNVTDISRALTNYLVLPLKDKSLDLNKDEVVNELDVFLIRQNLLIRGVIK